jgi:hypothetical protein
VAPSSLVVLAIRLVVAGLGVCSSAPHLLRGHRGTAIGRVVARILGWDATIHLMERTMKRES